ncbi:uncharacterized protein LOC127621222 [Xyrauchen texanus]|uniref:uncharacterized protein LOC127621222 n=1 Tax=Xyrauchen texanus TaxID=154827 RepID=UPI002242BEFE|nr:uncharacterized protein LOC127621222 [Xyrauchen texanus]
MESLKQHNAVNKIHDEQQNDSADGKQYDNTDTGQHDIPVGKMQPDMTDAQDITEDKFENVITEDTNPQNIMDDNRQHEVIEDNSMQGNQHNINDADRSYNITEDKQYHDIIRTRLTSYNRSAYLRVDKTSDGKLVGKTHYPATATSLTFPSTLIVRNPSPTISVLPLFYGTSFGYRIRTFNTYKPCHSIIRTRNVCNDNRFSSPMKDMRHIIEIKGNPCLLKTKAEAVISPHPKIISTVRGAQTHKIKTTKTFLWGPEGLQEAKTASWAPLK